MPVTRVRRFYEILISLFVVFALLLQASLVVRAATGRIGGPRLWPFINYAMYDNPHFEGEIVNAYYLIGGTRADGTSVDISREDLQLNLWHYLTLGRELEKGRPEAVELLREAYGGSGELVEITLKTLPVRVTRTGRAETPSVLVRRIAVPGAPGTSAPGTNAAKNR